MTERWAREVLKPLLGGQGLVPVQPKYDRALFELSAHIFRASENGRSGQLSPP